MASAFGETVTTQMALAPPTAVAVTTACPGPLPVTLPVVGSTVRMLPSRSLVLHVTVLTGALAGETEADRVKEPSAGMVCFVSLSVTLSTSCDLPSTTVT